MTLRAIIYVRVSSVEQASEQHVSLQVQEERCRAYVEQRGWELAGIERDTESGLKSSRPGYQRLLARARAGGLDAVVVHAASRFGRDAGEVLTRAKELREIGVTLASTAEDLSSFLMLGIQAVMNEEESRRLSARVGPAKRLKASQGFWLGHAPFGTVNVKGILQPGPHFDLLTLAYGLCADGVPLRQIAARINAARSPSGMTVSTLRKIIRNPAYRGEVRWADVNAPALWPPLIDPELWTRANDRITARYVMRAPLSVSYPFWILGLAFHACGRRMHPKVSVRTWGTRYAYLFCPDCKGAHHLIEDVQGFVVREIERLRFEGVDELITALSAAQEGVDAAKLQRLASLRSERDRLTQRLQTAKSAHLDAPQTFTVADVRQVEASVRDTIAAIDRELQPADAEPIMDIAALRVFLEEREWLQSEPRALRDFLRGFIERVEVAGRQEYRIRWRIPTLA